MKKKNSTKNWVNLMSRSITRTIFMVFLFILAYVFHNHEIVREGIGDKGFDIINKIFLSTEKVETLKSPSLLVFGYDNDYMLAHKLFDEDNNTNYGNFFYRSRMVEFIDVLDNRSRRLKDAGLATPKAFFLDFDLTFTFRSDGKTLSTQDKALLSVLKKERDYVIILSKTQSANFVEQSEDKEIQRLIEEEKIIFASVNFSRSRDNTVRRYRVYETFHTQDKNSTYLNANIVLWKLAQNKSIDQEELLKTFTNQDVVSNRIVIKDYEVGLPFKSYWQGYKHYSALRHMPSEVLSKQKMLGDKAYENAIVMLGTSYTNNGDTFSILNVLGVQEMSGVALHANTLMTLFYFDGQLQLLALCSTLVLVSLLVFLLDFSMAMLLKKLNIKESKWTNIMLLLCIVFYMFLASLLLIKHGYWFDWLAPKVFLDRLM